MNNIPSSHRSGSDSPFNMHLSNQGMQLLDRMNKDEQATFLEFQKRIHESQGQSTASSLILAQIDDESEARSSTAIPTPPIEVPMPQNVFDY